MNKQDTVQWRSIHTAYYVTLALLIVGGLIGKGRIWGFDWWSYFPVWSWATAFVALAFLPLVLKRVSFSWHREATIGRFLLVSSIGIAACLLAFVLFANQTHFLGDGIQILHNLQTGVSTHMFWNIPAEWIEARAFDLVGGATQSDAQLALRLISYLCGMATVVALLWFARSQGMGLGDSWLFAIGIISSGIGLFFFGYVETYPPFICMVVLTCTLGMAAARDRLSFWWPVAAWAMATALHLFAVALFPAVAYLAIRKTKIWKKVAALHILARIMLVVAAFGCLIGVISFLALRDYQIRFMLVPFLRDEFTVGGYTMFSASHLVDLVNLAILLLPSGIFLLAGLQWRRTARTSAPEKWFAAIASVSACFLVFVFDPKLGMLRDWDLFAFAVIPAVVFLAYRYLSSDADGMFGRFVIVLAIALNLAVLVPRVAVAMSPDRSLEMVDRIFALESAKARSLHFLVVEYLRDHGYKAKGDSLAKTLTVDYPELKIMEQAVALFNQGRIQEAIGLADRARLSNPMSVDAYTLLCACYSALGRLSEALTVGEIAFGLNARNADISYNLANIYARMGKTTEARAYIDRSLAIDPGHRPSMYALATLAVAAHDRNELQKWLVQLPVQDTVESSKFHDLMLSACARKMWPEAAELLTFGLRHRLDSAVVRDILGRFPEISSPQK